jgi:hypothetical protein
MSRQQLYLILAFIVAATVLNGQSQSPPEYIAFRVDDGRVIATVLVRDDSDRPQVREGLSPRPIAQFGYEHFEPPEAWGNLQTDHRAGHRWLMSRQAERSMRRSSAWSVATLDARKPLEPSCGLLRIRRRRSAQSALAILLRHLLKEKRRARLPGNHPFAGSLRPR